MEHFHRFSRIALFAFLLAISASIFSCDDSPIENPEAQKLTGTIIDDSGVPVKDAFVGVVDETDAVIDSTLTDAGGAFTLSSIVGPVDKYSLLVVHKDFSAIREKLKNFFNKSQKKFPIKLQNDSCCGKLEVQVFKKSDSSAVQNAQVKLSVGNVTLKVLQTGENGKAVFENLCFMKYWIRVAKDGYKVVEEDFTIENCDPKVVKVYIDTKENGQGDSCCHGVVYFVSQNGDGQSLKEVNFRLKKIGGDVREGKTDANGVYTFTSMCPGKYSFSYSKDGYKGGEFEFELGCNDTLELVKKLTPKPAEDSCCHGKLKVLPRVAGTDIPINGAKVVLWKNGKQITSKISENGYVLFENLCEGTYGLDIFKEQYKHIEFQVELGCNDNKEVEKYLSKENSDSCCNGVVYLRVKNSEGEYLRNVSIKLWKGSTVLGEFKTNDDGGYALTKMCPGKYAFSFKLEGYKEAEYGFELGCNDTLEYTKVLVKNVPDTCCTAKLKLRVQEAGTEINLSGVRVEIYKNDQLISDPNTNAEGWAVAEGLCAPVKYEVVFKKDGYVTKTVEFTFNECKTITETIRLTKQ
ncbi:MAG: MSCRAMM family protein [Chloroflexota bacterium]